MTVVILPDGQEAFRVGPPEVTTKEFIAHLGTGRATAMRASELAAELRVSERHVGVLAAAAIDEGWLVGSVCSGPMPGYFLIWDEEDLRIGTEHIRARALASLARLSKLRKTATEVLGEPAARLFDVQELTR